MSLTSAQRRKLPRSAFVYAPKSAPRSSWKYPVPTRAQAKRAGISEGEPATHRPLGDVLRRAPLDLGHPGPGRRRRAPPRPLDRPPGRPTMTGQAAPARTFESFAAVFEPAPLGPPRPPTPPPTPRRSKQPPYLGVSPPLPPLPPRQAPRRPRFLLTGRGPGGWSPPDLSPT